MTVIATFKSEEIFPLVKKRGIFTFNGIKVPTGTRKLRAFKKQPYCSCCGLEGNIFRLQSDKSNNIPYLQFFSERKAGGLVLMNRDHIIPYSQCGHNKESNLQTMCSWCNTAKGDKFLTKEVIEEIRSNMPFFNTLVPTSAKQRIIHIMKKNM